MASLVVYALVVIAFVVFAALGSYLVFVYNRLVRLSQQCDRSRHNVDVLLKQRQAELTKLIDAVGEYTSHEHDLLVELTQARELADQASTPSEAADADRAVRQAIATFRARAEEYPELRSSTNMRQLQERITDIENQIAARREFYNAAATTYNTRINMLPYALFADSLGFEEVTLFTASDEQRADVDVEAAFAG